MNNIPTQAQVRSNNSIFGRFGDKRNLVEIKLPASMVQQGKSEYIQVHQLIAQDVYKALVDMTHAYGDKLAELKLNNITETYNVRWTNSRRTRSLHGWGIAIDIDATDVFNKKITPAEDYNKLFEIWSSYGAVVSECPYNKTHLHIQFAS